jgi:hypothetical protein
MVVEVPNQPEPLRKRILWEIKTYGNEKMRVSPNRGTP